MDLRLSFKTRVLLFILGLIIAFIVIPTLQKIHMNSWIEKTHVEVAGSNNVEIAQKDSQNKTSSFLGLFLFHIIINIADISGLNWLYNTLFGAALFSESTSGSSGVTINNFNYVRFAISLFGFFSLIAILNDIYIEAFAVSDGFKNTIDAFTTGIKQ